MKGATPSRVNWAPQQRSANGPRAVEGTGTSWPAGTPAPRPDGAGWALEPGRAASPFAQDEARLGASTNDAGTVGPEREEKPAPRHRPVWLRRTSFRSRITLLVATAVGFAVAMAALSSYLAVSRQLESQANNNLQSAVNELIAHGPGGIFGLAERTGDKVQVITAGQIYSINYNQGSSAGGFAPDYVPDSFFAFTGTAKQTYISGGRVTVQSLTGADGNPYLVATVPVSTGQLAIQIGYPVTNMDNTLAFLRFMLILVAVCGVAVAATLGWAVGRATMRPVEELTLTAEHVAATQDLTATIDDTGKDELGRLARSFNAMLAALSVSREQQAQLVSDAGHELRTPLTSLRTNIEVLMRAKDLAGPDREELLADVDAQLKELSTLVGDLVDLARTDERGGAEPEAVAFDKIVERAVERAQRRAMSVHFDVSLQPGEVLARPALLERAVMNVLDNAAKWSPAGGHVGVRLEANSAWHLSVTDQGPGIAAEDLPHVFDRFYRAPTARSMPGSGLGLAIVKDVVSSHGGSIGVATPPGGGTRVDIMLPLEPASPAALDGDAGTPETPGG